MRLRREELTGALAPLADVPFFEQVLIDCGAVAWPGEIDLAPDAMYAQMASQRDGEQPAEPVESRRCTEAGGRGVTRLEKQPGADAK